MVNKFITFLLRFYNASISAKPKRNKDIVVKTGLCRPSYIPLLFRDALKLLAEFYYVRGNKRREGRGEKDMEYERA